MNISKYILTATIIIFLAGLVSCSGRNTPATPENKKIQEETNTLSMNLAEVDSMQIIYTDDEIIERYIPNTSWKTIENNIQSAVYDSVWNRGDIMIKMIAPDYTIIISYKNKSSDKNDWMMIWSNDGKMKYRNIWYVLNEDSKNTLIQLFESLRTKDTSN